MKDVFSLKNKENYLLFALIFAVFLGTALKIFYWQNFTFDKFIDRDILRGIYPDSSFWIEGSELSGGGRTPGGAMNILMYILYRLSFGHVVGIYFWFCLFHFLGILWVSHSVKSYFGKTAAWATAAFMSVNYIFLEQFVVLWNPTFSFLFFCGVFSLTLTMFAEKRSGYLPFVIALIAISSQLHLSNIILLPVIFLTALIIKFKWPWRHLLWSLMVFVFLYSPFLWRELTENAVFFHSWKSDPALSFSNYALQYVKVFLNYVGVIFFSESPGLQWSHRTFFKDSIFFNFRFVFVLVSLLPLLCLIYGLFYRSTEQKYDFSPIRVLRVLFIVSLTMMLPALLISYSNQEINYRRFLWVEPFFISLCAAGFAQATSVFTSLYRQRGLTVASAVIVLYSTIQVIYAYANESVTQRQESFAFKKEVVEVARKEFNLSDFEIEHQIGLIAKEDYNGVSGEYIIKTSQKDDGSGLKVFLSQLENYPAPTSLNNKCVFAIRDASDVKGREAKYNSSYLLKLLEREGLNAQSVHIDKIFHGKEGSFFSFNKLQNNCFHFFTNYYFISEKQIIERMLNPSDPFVVSQESFGSHHRFAFREDIDQLDYYFLVDLEMHGHSVTGSLFVGTESFIPFESLMPFEKEKFVMGAQLVFTSTTGKGRHILPLFDFEGGLAQLVSPPLFFSFSKPPADSYTLELHVPLPNGRKLVKTLSRHFSTHTPQIPAIN